MDMNTKPRGLTLAQLEAEKRYRYEERLGILCGNAQPTDAQRTLAERDVQRWESYRMLKRLNTTLTPPV